MTSQAVDDPILTRFNHRTPASRRLWERAQRSMPMGVSANLKYAPPHPVHIAEASGALARDVDGNEYVDMTFGAGPHLLGHRHPVVERAVSRQLGRLWQHVVPHEAEIELAERLRARYPHMERIRFAVTGSEAMRNVIRVARAVTGRAVIAKLEGHYHGSDDAVLVSSKTTTVRGTTLRRFHMGILANGVLRPPGHSGMTCVVHDEALIDRVIGAADRVVDTIQHREGQGMD